MPDQGPSDTDVFRFEIRSLLELGDTSFVIARQLALGPFEVGESSLLGDAAIEPEVDEPRTSQIHDEVTEGLYIFTLKDQADAMGLSVGEIVKLTP